LRNNINAFINFCKRYYTDRDIPTNELENMFKDNYDKISMQLKQSLFNNVELNP